MDFGKAGREHFRSGHAEDSTGWTS
jgi:hypothetical protein